MSCLWPKGTLGNWSRMCDIFFQLDHTKPETYNSYGDKTTSYQRIRPECVHNEYSDDPDTSKNVPLPTEATEQIHLTPTASAAVDTKNEVNFNDHVMNDNDEPWATVAHHRTGWNKTFKRNVSWYAVWNCFARLSETSCITGKSKERPHKHA